MTRRIIRVFWDHARHYPFAFGIAVASVIFINIITVTIPLFYKTFFDTIGKAPVPTDAAAEILFSILTIVAFLAIGRWLAHRASGHAATYFESHVMTDLLQTSFEKFLGHSYKFFTDNFTGSLVRRAARLSRSFEEITDQILGNLLPLAVLMTGTLFVLFGRSPLLGSILLVWIILFLFVFYRISMWKIKYDRMRSEKDSEATGVISDALTNAVTIKLFSQQKYEIGLYRKVTRELQELRLFGWRIGEWLDAGQGILMIVAEIGLVWIGIRLWRDGRFSVGDFVLLQSYLIALFQRMWEFGRVIRRIYEALADASEMVEILNLPYEVKDIPGAKTLKVTEGKVEFRNVGFRFHETRKILDRFNLTIRPGEKISFVGSSGAGKTTVVSLLLRFHDLYEGEILVDGENISRVTQESLRRNIALVPQDPILFHRTLKENIRYGRLRATDEEVMDAAKKAHCHEFISRLPYGYDTFVGERGIKLSGGERQRVAIARAILAGTKILILDEATSSLDSEVEALIQDALRNLMANKTAIVIAHRLSTIVQMDRIIVIDEGTIIAEGKHEELLQKEGLYKKLWHIQAGGFRAKK